MLSVMSGVALDVHRMRFGGECYLQENIDRSLIPLQIICCCTACLRPLSKKFFFFLRTTGYYGSGTAAQGESHRMEDMSKKSRSVQELGQPRYETKQPRVGALPSVAGESEESLV
jgi:hypothetical protein